MIGRLTGFGVVASAIACLASAFSPHPAGARIGKAPSLAPEPGVASLPAETTGNWVSVRPESGESLARALTRIGVAPEEARRAASAARPSSGGDLRVELSWPDSGGAAKIVALQSEQKPFSLHPGAASPAKTAGRLKIMAGAVDGSLFLSMAEAGASPDVAAAASGVLGHRLDLVRDLESGDRFRLGLEGEAKTLRYVEVTGRAGTTRLFGLPDASSGRTVWVDEDGQPIDAGFLRTPVDSVRITSGFGLRLHPILGYTRMHQGVDFGAPEGSAVYAAADGRVEEARWKGGYGRWIEIAHGAGWETGYAHLSAYASGVRPGAAVRQGEIIGYVGQSGLATGPHLHFEVIRDGAHIDPAKAEPQFAARTRDVDQAAFAALESEVRTAMGG
jgi:murein DD-endopeptidase MepM/ murein hydrolase activator NlpD